MISLIGCIVEPNIAGILNVLTDGDILVCGKVLLSNPLYKDKPFCPDTKVNIDDLSHSRWRSEGHLNCIFHFYPHILTLYHIDFQRFAECRSGRYCPIQRVFRLDLKMPQVGPSWLCTRLGNNGWDAVNVLRNVTCSPQESSMPCCRSRFLVCRWYKVL